MGPKIAKESLPWMDGVPGKVKTNKEVSPTPTKEPTTTARKLLRAFRRLRLKELTTELKSEKKGLLVIFILMD